MRDMCEIYKNERAENKLLLKIHIRKRSFRQIDCKNISLSKRSVLYYTYITSDL